MDNPLGHRECKKAPVCEPWPEETRESCSVGHMSGVSCIRCKHCGEWVQPYEGYVHPSHHIPTEEECEAHGGGWCAKCQCPPVIHCAKCRMSVPDLREPCRKRS